MLRFIGRNEVSRTQKWIDEWVVVVLDWIEQGLKPFVFTHTPDDRWAPEFARLFNNSLAKKTNLVAPLDEWPFQVPKQKELF